MGINTLKILMLSNFTVDMGDPNFRVGAYTRYLAPLAESLERSMDCEVKYLLSKHVFEAIKKEKHTNGISLNNSYLINYNNEIHLFGVGDNFIHNSYNSCFTQEELNSLRGYFYELFKGWIPDMIFSWEFPTTLWREIFPDTVVLDLSPGLFMRPPYPRTIAIDPVGLYKDSVFGAYSRNPSQASDFELQAFRSIRFEYQSFFEKQRVEEKIKMSLRNGKEFYKYALVPLQISKYFGFYDNCRYNSQFDFLLDVLSNTSEDTGVIATQYIGSTAEERDINSKNIDFLKSNFPHFLYSDNFEKIDNISQFIVPWADETYSVSSTIGLQAKFFGKELISPSRSHLSYFADRTELANLSVSDSKKYHDDMMAVMLNRHTHLEKRLLQDREYLVSVINEFRFRKIEGATGMDLLPRGELIQSFSTTAPLHYKSYSTFDKASLQLKKIGIENRSINDAALQKVLKEMELSKVISFDIFDTLLCRSVFKPEDVFLIMQKELQSSNSNIVIPKHISSSFADLRLGSERQIRKERDKMLASGFDVSEELTIEEVYKFMSERFGNNDIDIDALIKLEQDIELALLKSRRVGSFLFNRAKELGKKVILVSDFIHDLKFIETALEKCNVTGYDAVFVSSEIGLKKHSGKLFSHVLKELECSPNEICHIGDNPIGDWVKAVESDWKAIRISSTREVVLDILKERNIATRIFNESFYLRTVFALFSEIYYDGYVFNKIDAPSINGERELIQTEEEFGFLALGPLLYSFSEWILNRAVKNNCKSVLFFARDCFIPYQIAKEIIRHREEYRDINLHYIATSRQGLKGLNIERPEDFLSIRIDDYSKTESISSLIIDRFGLDINAIPESILNSWGIESVDRKIGNINPTVIYGIVYSYACSNWTTIKQGLLRKKETYERYLIEQGIDLASDTLAVDFGYKGSTHRMLRNFFKGKFIPAFFMTYSNEFGNDPIENSEVYYLKNLNSAIKNSVTLLSHNLIIETLINEPVGSLVEIYEDANKERTIIKEDLGSLEHIRKVSSIHRGIMRFANNWLKRTSFFDGVISEPNSSTFWLDFILKNPSKVEAKLLQGLMFDNSFSGRANRYLVGFNSHERGIWEEGCKILYSDPYNIVSNYEGDAELVGNTIVIGQMKFPKKVDVLRYLHRDLFSQAVSKLSVNPPATSEVKKYSKLIKNHTKRYVAARMLQENGGIKDAKINLIEKVKMYYSLVRRK